MLSYYAFSIAVMSFIAGAAATPATYDDLLNTIGGTIFIVSSLTVGYLIGTVRALWTRVAELEAEVKTTKTTEPNEFTKNALLEVVAGVRALVTYFNNIENNKAEAAKVAQAREQTAQAQIRARAVTGTTNASSLRHIAAQNNIRDSADTVTSAAEIVE